MTPTSQSATDSVAVKTHKVSGVAECRICGDVIGRAELTGGVCDECDLHEAAMDDQSWGAHEHG